jgi:hypothetical protein
MRLIQTKLLGQEAQARSRSCEQCPPQYVLNQTELSASILCETRLRALLLGSAARSEKRATAQPVLITPVPIVPGRGYYFTDYVFTLYVTLCSRSWHVAASLQAGSWGHPVTQSDPVTPGCPAVFRLVECRCNDCLLGLA